LSGETQKGDAEGIMIEEKMGIRLGATDPRRSDGLAVGIKSVKQGLSFSPFSLLGEGRRG
jgi:hypothetical protein